MEFPALRMRLARPVDGLCGARQEELGAVVFDSRAEWGCYCRAWPLQSAEEMQGLIPGPIWFYRFGDQRWVTSQWPRVQAAQTPACLPTSLCQWCETCMSSCFWTCRSVSSSKGSAFFLPMRKFLLFYGYSLFLPRNCLYCFLCSKVQWEGLLQRHLWGALVL